jgi:hypothetical protein
VDKAALRLRIGINGRIVGDKDFRRRSVSISKVVEFSAFLAIVDIEVQCASPGAYLLAGVVNDWSGK